MIAGFGTANTPDIDKPTTAAINENLIASLVDCLMEGGVKSEEK